MKNEKVPLAKIPGHEAHVWRMIDIPVGRRAPGAPSPLASTSPP